MMNLDDENTFEENEEEESYQLSLTETELFHLENMMQLALIPPRDLDPGKVFALSMMRPNRSRSGIAVPVNLIEKIGKAILVLMDDEIKEDEVILHLDGGEIWMIREVTHCNGNEQTELLLRQLKTKVYSALYGAEYERDKNIRRLLESQEEPNKNTADIQPTARQ